jgi:hypothetical protein
VESGGSGVNSGEDGTAPVPMSGQKVRGSEREGGRSESLLGKKRRRRRLGTLKNVGGGGGAVGGGHVAGGAWGGGGCCGGLDLAAGAQSGR